LVVVMMVPRPSGKHALRVLSETVPWAGVTRLPSVSPTIAFGLSLANQEVHLIANDEANERQLTYVVDTSVGDAQRAARAIDRVVTATFN
jgi:hypothetical protein